ncbi:MAG: antibiotic biosynthesis monooxygenase [Actinomycetes bacterium]
MSKTSMILKLTAQDGRRDDLLAALSGMLPTVNDEEGTEIYAFNYDDSDANVIWIYEVYSSKEAMDLHSATPAMAELLGAVGPLLGTEPPLWVSATPMAGKGIGL